MSKHDKRTSSLEKFFNAYLKLTGLTTPRQVAHALDLKVETVRTLFKRYGGGSTEAKVVQLNHSNVVQLNHNMVHPEPPLVHPEPPPIYKERAHPSGLLASCSKKENSKEKEKVCTPEVDPIIVQAFAKLVAGDFGVADAEGAQAIFAGHVQHNGVGPVSSAAADMLGKHQDGEKFVNPWRALSSFIKQAASRPQSAAATGKSVEDRSPKKDQVSTLQTQSDPIQEMRSMLGDKSEVVENHLAYLSNHCLSKTEEQNRPREAARYFVRCAKRHSIRKARAGLVKIIDQIRAGGRAPQNFAYVEAISRDCEDGDALWTRYEFEDRKAKFVEEKFGKYGTIDSQSPEYLDCINRAQVG